MRSRVSGSFDAGPRVATILVLRNIMEQAFFEGFYVSLRVGASLTPAPATIFRKQRLLAAQVGAGLVHGLGTVALGDVAVLGQRRRVAPGGAVASIQIAVLCAGRDIAEK